MAQRYAYPWFHQNWNLFAPAPDANYRLIADYGDSLRIDLFHEVVAMHQANRLLGYEPLVIAFSNSIHYFEKSTALQQPVNGPVKKDASFAMLELSAQNYLRFTGRVLGPPRRLILVVDNIKTKSRRIYFN